MKLSREELAAIRERAAEADRAMTEAERGRMRMSIPAEPDRDTDLVCASLARELVPALLAHVEALESELEDLQRLLALRADRASH